MIPTHQINGNDEIVLLSLSLLLVLAGLHGGGFRCDLHLAFLSRRLLGWFCRALSTRRDLLTGRRCLLTGGTLLVHVTHAIRRFVASLQRTTDNFAVSSDGILR